VSLAISSTNACAFFSNLQKNSHYFCSLFRFSMKFLLYFVLVCCMFWWRLFDRLQNESWLSSNAILFHICIALYFRFFCPGFPTAACLFSCH
jgi:hypothetical protein